ncbi:MAG: sporulation protein YtfJ [Oscillospiraceae bacterium]|nr:sporulation protein YtfJ [Oscillospiraceae bacterium]
MERNTLGEVMGISMTKMKEMVNVNTIIGDPIYTPDGITLIPVTQVSMGMGAGGADSMNKNTLGAGAGGGVKMNPQGFLIIKDGMIRFVSTKAPADTSLDRLLDMIPDVFDRVEKLIKDAKEKKNPTV